MAVFERFLKYLKSSQFMIRYFGIIFTYRWRGESRAVAAWKSMKESENQIIVYEPNETIRLDVRLENETV